jgi:hypothetical protein
VRNGWNFPLEGLTARWELFAKTGKSSSSVAVLKSGESEPMDLGRGQSCEFETPMVEFRSTDSRTEGFTGNKFYGYRVRFYYKNTLVRVVALPTTLSDWQPSDTTQ